MYIHKAKSMMLPYPSIEPENYCLPPISDRFFSEDSDEHMSDSASPAGPSSFQLASICHQIEQTAAWSYHCQILSQTQPHCEVDGPGPSNDDERQEDSSHDKAEDKEIDQKTLMEALVPSPAPAQTVVETIEP